MSSWTEVERAFFAAAPPDEPQAPAEPECFDDLTAPEPRRQEYLGASTAMAAAWSAFRRLVLGGARRSRAASPL